MDKGFAVLGVSTVVQVNIGDYIQGLASMQFLTSKPKVIQRELLKDYNGGEVRMFMNGWYMHNTNQWPPSSEIDPCFVAFHMNVLTCNGMLTHEGINYLKIHEPIGCRDSHTVEVLKNHGINAYFSGCMTLTLGETYKSEKNSGKVYFVDPALSIDKDEYIDIVKFIVKHPKKILKIAKSYYPCAKDSSTALIKSIFFSAQFLRKYSKIFDESTLLKAEFICQQAKYIKRKYPSEESLFEYAKYLVRKYAEADFVVTSRIHCALPCLGLETPVIYVESKNDSDASKCRYGGLRELFTTLTWDGKELSSSFPIKRKIKSSNDFPENKKSWKPIARNLINTCKSWIKQDKL